jgi:hypothetical protein
MTGLLRACQAIGEFVLGLALLCLLASLAVFAAVVISVGFIGGVLLSEAAATWDTLRANIRNGP